MTEPTNGGRHEWESFWLGLLAAFTVLALVAWLIVVALLVVVGL